MAAVEGKAAWESAEAAAASARAAAAAAATEATEAAVEVAVVAAAEVLDSQYRCELAVVTGAEAARVGRRVSEGLTVRTAAVVSVTAAAAVVAVAMLDSHLWCETPANQRKRRRLRQTAVDHLWGAREVRRRRRECRRDRR